MFNMSVKFSLILIVLSLVAVFMLSACDTGSVEPIFPPDTAQDLDIPIDEVMVPEDFEEGGRFAPDDVQGAPAGVLSDLCVELSFEAVGEIDMIAMDATESGLNETSWIAVSANKSALTNSVGVYLIGAQLEECDASFSDVTAQELFKLADSSVGAAFVYRLAAEGFLAQ